VPRTKKLWFRLYVEAVDDPKLRRLSLAQRWLWICVLAAARASPEPGFLLVTPEDPLTPADLAHTSGMALRSVQSTLTLMDKLGLITYAHDVGTFYVTAWWERQFESDFRGNHHPNGVR
jgi:hypothetical protein